MLRKLQTIGKMGLGSLLLSTALAACTVGPDYTPPKTELAPFHNTAGAAGATGSAVPPLDHWWTGFNDPMLVTVVQRSLDENLDLEAAWAHRRLVLLTETDKSAADRNESRYSAFLYHDHVLRITLCLMCPRSLSQTRGYRLEERLR